MNRRFKIPAVLALMVVGFLAPASPASATTFAGEAPSGPSVLLFSKDPFTDADEEDVSIRNALISVSSTVTVFDGGNGSATAWQTALSGKTILVFPEVDGGNTYWAASNTAVLTAEAKTYIKDWVSAGKTIIGTGSYSHRQAITDLTGVSFTSVVTANLPNTGDTWEKQVTNPNLPATVPKANYTGGIKPYSTLSTAQKAVMEVVYYDSAEDNAAVINFRVGSGFYVYNAYDWYPDSGDISSGRRAAWNATLQFAATGQITGQAAAPTSAPPSVPPAPRVPRFDAFASGPVVAMPGQDLVLAGARLNCTTQVQINDRSTSFSHSFLATGQESMTIRIPSTLGPGRHKLAMDSCDGNVVYENIIFVPKPPVVFEAVTTNSFDRMFVTAKLQSFVLKHYSDYNSVECVVNSTAKSLEKSAAQFLESSCKLASMSLAQKKGYTTEKRSTHKPANIWIRVTLTNK